MTLVIKEDGRLEDFDKRKIANSIFKVYQQIGLPEKMEVCLAEASYIEKLFESHDEIHIEDIRDEVEKMFFQDGHFSAAKYYIKRRVLNKKDIFKKRINLKPYEYPQLLEFIDAIRFSYWIHTEFNYTSDIQDIKTQMTEGEASIIKNAMLAIAQIEVAVKTFWGNIYSKMPKPEIQSVGATFSESEVRHADAYSNLIELLGLNDEFEKLIEIPVIKERISYLDKTNKEIVENKEYFHKIILFTMFIENVSLFSQFLIMMSFNRHKNMLKGISNAVEATSKEEDIHARFGFEIVNIIKQEHPEWFDKETISLIIERSKEAYLSESAIVDWIYGEEDLNFLPKYDVKEFIKDRINQSLVAIGIEKLFKTDNDSLNKTKWFVEETLSTKNTDFFMKRSTAYSKKNKSFTEDDLF